jgi:hypothetical protein
VYVYRETGDRPGDAAAAAPDEHDPAYWYDDLAGDTAPAVPEEARGPFEPLVSSADPPGTPSGPPPAFGAGPAAAEPLGAADSQLAAGSEAASGADEGREDSAYARARKLEQIKDLYLTAEAIGEDNVDKHFDHLLAQQRELISEYFRRSGAGSGPGAEPGRPGDGKPGGPGPVGGPAGSPEGAGVAAEPPRTW